LLSIKKLRHNAKKMDASLRHCCISMARPPKWLPCYFHSIYDRWMSRWRKIKVIVEFYPADRLDNEHLEDVEKVLVCMDRHGGRGERMAFLPYQTGKVNLNILTEVISYSCVKKVHLDREVHALLDHAASSIKADVLWEEGFTGKGIGIAIIDTGVYAHPDLTEPFNRITAFKDFVNRRTDPYDDNGHGTHCAGDAAGNGFVSEGMYKGPAYEAEIIGVKVLNKMGSGNLSTIVQGVEWCIQHKEDYRLRVLSMSLGASATSSCEDDPLCRIVEKAWDAGLVVCVAAGNEGPEPGTVASPGIAPSVITVGAMDDRNTVIREDDVLADFSSRGPTSDGRIKPDVLAPGVNIISLRSPGAYIDKTAPDRQVNDSYIELSGTSMATPICAGVVAQILESDADLTPDEVKAKLLQTAEDWGLKPVEQGNGYIDAEKALL
jgi:serine protease AprX